MLAGRQPQTVYIEQFGVSILRPGDIAVEGNNLPRHKLVGIREASKRCTEAIGYHVIA
jgi:hypothetical protein